MLDNEFDRKLRSMLEDATGEVPEGVWEGVSASLDRDAARKRRIPPVFWWWMSSGVAVAASLALILILWPAKPPVRNATVLEEPPSYEIEKAEYVPASLPEAAGDAGMKPVAGMPVPVAEVAATETTDVPAAAEPVGAPAPADPVDVPAPVETVDAPAPADPAAAKPEVVTGKPEAPAGTRTPEPRTPARGPRPLMLTASGNAFAALGMKGSGGGNNGMKKAPALLKAPSETGVTRTGGTTVYGLPVTAGVGVRYYVSRRVSLGTALEYTYLTRTFSGTYNEVAATGDGGSQVVRSVTSDVIRNEQHYLGVPVNVYVDVLQSKRFRAYAHAGGAVEKSVKSHYKIPSGNGIISWSEKVKGVQWSVGGGIGMEVRLGEHVGLFVDPGVKYYFDGKQPGSIRTAQPLMMNVDMGVRFNIN